MELLELAEEIAFGNLKKIRPDIARYSYAATVGGDPRRQHVSEALRSDSSTSGRQRQPPHNVKKPIDIQSVVYVNSKRSVMARYVASFDVYRTLDIQLAIIDSDRRAPRRRDVDRTLA